MRYIEVLVGVQYIVSNYPYAEMIPILVKSMSG